VLGVILQRHVIKVKECDKIHVARLIDRSEFDLEGFPINLEPCHLEHNLSPLMNANVCWVRLLREVIEALPKEMLVLDAHVNQTHVVAVLKAIDVLRLNAVTKDFWLRISVKG